MSVLLRILAVLAALALASLLAEGLTALVRTCAALPIALCHGLRDRLAGGTHRASAARAGLGRALAYHPGELTERDHAVWDVVSPVAYAGLAAVLVAGDVFLASLRFGALLGLEVTTLGIPNELVDLLAGVLFVAIIAVYGGVWLDVHHVTPLGRPFGRLHEPIARIVATTALAGVVLSVVAAVLFFVWGQGAIEAEPNSDIALLFAALLAALLVPASMFALAAAIPVVVVVVLVVVAVVELCARLVTVLLALLATAVEGVRDIVVSAIALVGLPGDLVRRRFGRARD